MDDDAGLDRFFIKAAEFEKTIAAFYRAVARRFPEHAGFWSQAADEEDDHAAWLESALDVVETARAKASLLRPMVREIEEGIRFVNAERFKAGDGTHDERWAVQAAKLIEASSLEKYFTKHVIGLDDEVRELLARMGRAEREHSDRLAEFEKTLPPKR